jgi:hypothetical protein
MASSAGCVTKTRYEEAKSGARVEREGRRRSQDEVVALTEKLNAVTLQLKQREQRLEEQGDRIAEADLARDIALAERQTATELVEQLRMDLERTGVHLRSFADEKNRLSTALDAAAIRAKKLDACEQNASDNAAIVRDLALILKEPVTVGDIELDSVDGRAVLRLPASEVQGETLSPAAEKLMQGVARVLGLHSSARATVAQTKSNDAARLRAVADRLSALGIASSRVRLEPSQPGGSGPATVEITLYVDNATAPPADSDEPTVVDSPPS